MSSGPMEYESRNTYFNTCHVSPRTYYSQWLRYSSEIKSIQEDGYPNLVHIPSTAVIGSPPRVYGNALDAQGICVS